MSMIDIQNERKKFIHQLLQNLRPVAAFAKGFAGTLSGLIILFAAATSMYEANAWLPALSAFLLALSMSVVIAAVLVGFLLGFLFGIPKTLQRATCAARRWRQSIACAASRLIRWVPHAFS
jgi:hypothetical protein